ncbi:MAG: hypothetical protein KDD34_05750 [Bdellovibrionales bacterium]|nr:hypothetical protein [Bdellovibrionales bacterium]
MNFGFLFRLRSCFQGESSLHPKPNLLLKKIKARIEKVIMNKGHRSIVNWFLSGVSVSSVYMSLATITFVIGVLSFFALHQVEKGIHIFVKQYNEETFDVFVQSVFYLKFIVGSAFVSISIFIYLFGRGVKHHIMNQNYALEVQLESFLQGRYHERRQMRKHDELKNIMQQLHRLADKISGKKG